MSTETASSAPIEQAAPKPSPYEAFTEQKIANPQKSAKEIRDELNLSATAILKDALAKCSTEQEARDRIPQLAEELSVSPSLGRKALDGLEKFAAKPTGEQEAKDGTYKEDTPPVSQKKQTDQPPPSGDQLPAGEQLPPPAIEPPIEPTPKEQQTSPLEPIDPLAAKKNGEGLQGVFDALANWLDDPRIRIPDKDVASLGEDVVITVPALANRKNAALMHLGGLLIPRIGIVAQKAPAKLQAYAKSKKGQAA